MIVLQGEEYLAQRIPETPLPPSLASSSFVKQKKQFWRGAGETTVNYNKNRCLKLGFGCQNGRKYVDIPPFYNFHINAAQARCQSDTPLLIISANTPALVGSWFHFPF